MKRLNKGFYRISSLLLTLLMVLNVFVAIPLTANAAKKTEKSYEIAVVFDNSGSMYDEGSFKGWCRAKYAMEIFASMLNYDKGDKLWIYPMWEVTDGIPKNGDKGSYDPIPITKKEDINRITNLYTTNPAGTPFAPVVEAHKYMMTSKATDRWIIVLTDGKFNLGDDRTSGASFSKESLETKFKKFASNGINVQYLGFEAADNLESDPSNNFYSKKSTDASLKDDLIAICNSIFQRAALPADRLSGNTLDIFDISMNNLIVFAQGANAKITSMADSSGKDVKIKLDSGQRKYSTITAAGMDKIAKIDNTLVGQVVSFDESEAGKYTLNYSGADKVEIFYEPNVKLKVEFKDASGKAVDGSKGEIEAGEYTVTSSIIDGVTEKDVTNNELLGKVNIKTYVKTSKDKDYKAYDNNAKINLVPDFATDIYIVATYLKDFTLNSRDYEDLDWLKNLKVGAQSLEFEAKATVQQEGNWYKISDHDNWKPIRVDFTIKGKPLTAAQMEKVVFPLNKGTDGPSYRYEKLANESAYVIYVGQDANGKYVEPETGTYILKDQASYVDEYGSTHTADVNAVFDIQTYDKFWRWLFWILIILILILLWLFFMTRKVLPKNIMLDSGEISIGGGKKLDKKFIKVSYNKKGGSISVGTSNAVPADKRCSATFDLKPVDNRFVKSKDRRIKIVGINSSCKSIEINGSLYVKHKKGAWVRDIDADADTVKAFAKECRNPNFTLSRGGLLECKVKNSK